MHEHRHDAFRVQRKKLWTELLAREDVDVVARPIQVLFRQREPDLGCAGGGSVVIELECHGRRTLALCSGVLVWHRALSRFPVSTEEYSEIPPPRWIGSNGRGSGRRTETALGSPRTREAWRASDRLVFEVPTKRDLVADAVREECSREHCRPRSQEG